MTPEDYHALDATALSQRVRSGEIERTALIDLALARIEAVDARVGAVVALDVDGARRDARRLSLTEPFAGVPVLIKDTSVDVAGMPTRHGSRFYADAPPAPADSEFVRRLRGTGALVLGKTKTPEFAGDFTTEPRWLGPARNPWDLGRITGGSSGGAAAAVAAGMVPLAHGSDCGGSIRVPAACCGLVGLKPTRGRMPEGPGAGERVSGLNVEGLLTRSVRDTARWLHALEGHDPGAPYQSPPLHRAADGPTGARTRRLRIGLIATPPHGGTIDSEIEAQIEEVARLLSRWGHELCAFAWPDIAGAGDAAAVMWQAEIAMLIEGRIAALGREPRAEEIEPLSRYAWSATRRRSALDYLAAKDAQNQISRRMAHAFRELDALLLPTTAAPPPALGAFGGAEAFSYESWGGAAYAFAPFTEIFNLTGQPALSLPVGATRSGLPIGVQFAAAFGEDLLLLDLAQRLEDHYLWTSRRPHIA